jgi:hypothetical protein
MGMVLAAEDDQLSAKLPDFSYARRCPTIELDEGRCPRRDNQLVGYLLMTLTPRQIRPVRPFWNNCWNHRRLQARYRRFEIAV